MKLKLQNVIFFTKILRVYVLISRLYIKSMAFIQQKLVLDVHVPGGFPGGASGKEPVCECRRHKRHRFNPWIRKISWKRAQECTPILLPGKSHGQRSLVVYSP